MAVVQNCAVPPVPPPPPAVFGPLSGAVPTDEEIFDLMSQWCGSEGFACELQDFSAGFCEALAVEDLVPPPGLADDFRPRGLAMRLDGLPMLLNSEEMLEAALEQLGFDQLMLGQPMISAGDGQCSVTLTVSSFEAAVAIAEHFQACNWSGCEKVTVTALKAEASCADLKEGSSGMRRLASEFVPGAAWCLDGVPTASTSTTASCSDASDVDLCSEHEEDEALLRACFNHEEA